jgi:hypothetical protein
LCGKSLELGKDKDGRSMIQAAKIKIIRIVRNTESKPIKALTGSDDYRLVLGICEYYPTEFGLALAKPRGVAYRKQYKFRALLKYDPFQNKYRYDNADFGYIEEGKWLTNDVPE